MKLFAVAALAAAALLCTSTTAGAYPSPACKKQWEQYAAVREAHHPLLAEALGEPEGDKYKQYLAIVATSSEKVGECERKQGKRETAQTIDPKVAPR